MPRLLQLTALCLPLLCSGCPTIRDPEPDGDLTLTSSEQTSERAVAPGMTVADPSDSRSAGEQTDSIQPLLDRVDRTLQDNLLNRRLSTERNGAWQILHGILAYGQIFEVETLEGMQPAVEYLLQGGTVRGFEPLPGDRLGDPPRRGLRMEMQPSTKIGQGHRDQWLAVLAQAGLGPETTLRSGGHEFVIEDWVRQVEHDIPLNLELEFSWTLIGLLAYRPTDHVWTARDGIDYSIESLLQSEVEQSLPESACGGTHRLIGIAMSVDRRRAEGGLMIGAWDEAQHLLADSIEQMQQNQNPDGSYSAAYHHRTGWTRDLGEALGTTGHVLEFLSLAASNETLREPWVQRSARHLCDILDQCREIDLECGALYHALHGLQVYRMRLRESGVTSG